MVELDGAGDVTEILQGPYPNSFCISCHYDNVVPVERLIPVFDRNTCENEKGGKWKEYVTGYWPYSPYPPTDGISPDELDLSASNCTHCVKFEEGKKICTQESLEPDCEYTVLPNSLPGWHTPTLNCSGCHLPWGTKDLDLDSVADRFDKCPGTNEGEAVDSASTSETYGCSADQDPDAVTDEEVKKERHGKHLFYHNFTFDNPVNEAISHGYRVNQKNSKDKFENARRVRVVPQTLFDDRNKGEQITLGLFYKQGENGQGAPADAFLQVFKGGFSPENIVTHHLENRDGEVVSRKALNLSSSRPLAYKELELPWLDSSGIPTSVNTGVANPDYDVDQSGHKTPKVVKYEWDNANLADESGWKLPETDADGNPVLDEAGEPVIAEDEYGIPRIRCNPYENVFSTRLSIRGDFILTAYAYCVNWAAGKKAKDHYDFFARWSLDGGQNWTLPANVSQLKNHSESVADCRILQPDSDTNEFFVAVGTKENTPQPNPNVTELEEAEVFLDLFYSKAEKQSDGKFRFGAITKENPKYEEGALPYVNLDGEPTSVSGTYQNDIWIDYDENPAYPETVEEFDWLAKGDAFQGDVQVQCSPDGEKLFTVWEQELEIDESDSQTHFQGADIWFRKVLYPDPTIPGDLDNDQVVDATDRGIIMGAMNTTPDSSGWVGKADYDEDQQITYNDYRQWYIHYKAFAAQ
nr:hypothetical protein [Desulfonema ishimotonii]